MPDLDQGSSSPSSADAATDHQSSPETPHQSPSQPQGLGKREKYCSNCGKLESQLQTVLKQCARCKTAAYCTASCQREDWHMHKHFCKIWAIPSNKGRLNIRGPAICFAKEWDAPHRFAHDHAAKDEAARALAASFAIPLDIQCRGESCRVIDAVLSRLVCTGQDTDSNLALFFGANQVSQVKNTKEYVQIRYDAVSRFESQSYGFHAIQTWDREIPMHSWTPMPPTDAENAKMLLQEDLVSMIWRFLVVTGADLSRPGAMYLLEYCGKQKGNKNWPYSDDSLFELDVLREALKRVRCVGYMELDLEQTGLGCLDIPDEIPALMRKESIGLKEATIRVLGKYRQCPCPHGCDGPLFQYTPALIEYMRLNGMV